MIPAEIIKAIFFGKEVQIMDTLIAKSKDSEWGKLDASYRQARAMYTQARENYPEEWIQQFMTPFFTFY